MTGRPREAAMNSFGEMSRSVSVVGETGFLPEMEVVVGQLERGTIITRFSSGKKSSKPEKMMLTIRRETMCVHWYKATSAAAQASGQHFQKLQVKLSGNCNFLRSIASKAMKYT